MSEQHLDRETVWTDKDSDVWRWNGHQWECTSAATGAVAVATPTDRYAPYTSEHPLPGLVGGKGNNRPGAEDEGYTLADLQQLREDGQAELAKYEMGLMDKVGADVYFAVESDNPAARPIYFDREGNPISAQRWGELLETGVEPDSRYGPRSYKQVAEDTVGRFYLSTVWLGLDHGFGRGKPLIFETMIFDEGDGPREEWDQDCVRYSSEAEAAEGHARALADLRAGRAPWFTRDEDIG